MRNFQQHVVLCNNLNELIDDIIRERNIDDKDLLVRIGMDGGGGFLKICLSVFQLQRDTAGCGKRLDEKFKKDSGVKKIIILAIVPGVQENYANLKRLWLEAGIDPGVIPQPQILNYAIYS